MSILTNKQRSKHHGIALAIAMIIAVMSGLVHVSLHDIDDSGSGLIGHYECQLSQLPGALLPTLQLPPIVFGPILLFVFVLCSPSSPIIGWAWLARAPPL
ncbi:MAG: hypothetical protein JKY67_20600 [Pseudomonadales bacterium]|nr:hypothetical protein [Pseudomonadales bacterium]